MNKLQADGKFEQLKAKLQEAWAKLTDDDALLYVSNKDKFYGKLKENYGVAKEDAEKRIKKMEESLIAAADATKVA